MRSIESAMSKCPVCGNKGSKVRRITLDALLTPGAAARIADTQYRFCDNPQCRIVYFDEADSTFSRADLTVRVGVKEQSSPRPVCYCFDHTIEEIEAEVRATGRSSVLDDIKTRIKTACWCETKNPQGVCCLGAVGRYVKRALAEHASRGGSDTIEEKPHECCAHDAVSTCEMGHG